MDVLKHWKLNKSLENIVNVADEAQKNFVLNNHEYKYVMENENNLQRSQRLIKMVSYYNDNLDTFLDILRTTENESLAVKISEKRDKKTEFVFIIKEKKTLLRDEKEVRKHNSFCKIPRQFIYEESINDAIAKVKERYKCRKPVADIFYVTIDCKCKGSAKQTFKNSHEKAFVFNSSEMFLYDFLKEMHNIFNENTEIKIILFVNESYDNLKMCCLLPNIEMYVIKEEENNPLKDLEMCENIMSMLSKIPEKKVIFCNTALYFINLYETGREFQKELETNLDCTNIISTNTKNFTFEENPLITSIPEMKYCVFIKVGSDKDCQSDKHCCIENSIDKIYQKIDTFIDTSQNQFNIVICNGTKKEIKLPKYLKNIKFVSNYVIENEDLETFMKSLEEKRCIEKVLKEDIWQQK